MLSLQNHIVETHTAELDFHPPSHDDVPSFDQRIVAVSNFLPEHTFQILLSAVNRERKDKRVHIPAHKRGSAISYHNLHYQVPEVIAFYHSRRLHQWCSSVVGDRLAPTPLNDLSSCSLLIYDKAGDRIGWHRDLNFYRGRHFTALLSLVNQGRAEGKVSSARLMIRKDRNETVIPTPANTFVLFEGMFVCHGVSALGAGERRIILSMTFCTEGDAGPLQSLERRFKDIAYFGFRALWT